jgi:sugar phosphate isomerase/epimerase
MMQIGIFAKTFPRSTLEEAMDAAVEHGLHCMQFNLAVAGLPTMPDQINPELIDRIRCAAEMRRIDLSAISGTFNMIHPNQIKVQADLNRLAMLAAACASMGTKIITLCTGTRNPLNQWHWHPDNLTPEAWHDLTSAMQQALEIADRYDVTLAIEPELNNVVDSAQKGRKLLDEMQSPRLKVVMDGANLFKQGTLLQMRVILEEAFALLGSDIVIAHAKDLTRDGEAGQEAAGNGLLDYDYYIELLRAVHYTGPLILHGLGEDQVDRSVAFLRSKLNVEPEP